MEDNTDWGKALIVGNRPGLLDEYRDALLTRCSDVLLAPNIRSAFEHLEGAEPISVVIVDLDTVSGAVWVAVGATLARPSALIVAFHDEPLEPGQEFMLGRRGVDLLLDGMPGAGDLLRELTVLRDEALPEITRLISPFVGRMNLNAFETEVRRAFIDHAMARASSNKSEAARMLGVQRFVVQRELAKRSGIDELLPSIDLLRDE